MALTAADKKAVAAMVAEGITAALTAVQDTPAPKGRGKGRGKGAKQDNGVGRSSTFPLANLVTYQGVDEDLGKGDTFTYTRSRGRGESTWKVDRIAGDTVHATRIK